MLWVDTYTTEDESEAEAIMEAFKPFFADASIKKVWHNFSFDRHVLNNHGIDCQGLEADTIHMARLFDASRLQGGGPGYSLEALSRDMEVMKELNMDIEPKISMKDLFEKPVIKKDGTEGKLRVMPPVHEIQLDVAKRPLWIHYSALDAKATWELYLALRKHLVKMDCHPNGFDLPKHVSNMWELYKEYWLPLGQLLTDMEAAGVLVNREHLAGAEVLAKKDQETARARFKGWAGGIVPDATLMNVSSGLQVRQLFFAGVKNKKTDEHIALEKTFQIPNEDPEFIEEGKKKWRKHRDIVLWGLWGRGCPSPLQPEQWTPTGWPATGTPVLRALAGKSLAAVKALQELGKEPASKLTPLDSSDESMDAAVSSEATSAAPSGRGPAGDLQDLEAEARAKGLGSLYAAFGGGIAGLEACAATDALVEINAIDTLLSNFILPLQGDAIATPDHRVHCSLNINTETGRLSARRPNLQNQPALEKDRYQIRKAFTAGEGKSLVVADYGQLELRLLAHMARCKSMLEAFELGGDFHSRTALGMYDYIREAVDRGECLLEWDYPEGKPPPVPLIKDKYGSERRKAKVLNFSIAYGKTAHGLSKDFNTSIHEAEETVSRWYADRWEVKEWQKRQRNQAKEHGYVCTLIGRRRILPGINSDNKSLRGHAERAAINTPIQGAAADVATAAMISIHRSPRLRELGWKLLLQVHDEVILEGPTESAEEAQAIVVSLMERPFDGTNPLSVELKVDSNVAKTWYEAK
uniref:DNA polymerase I n=2 Tax=Tetraselmis sp. GSL018 TaxID=582737 RepID=A0A061RMH8_9CHLO